jgi:hypothetical protein
MLRHFFPHNLNKIRDLFKSRIPAQYWLFFDHKLAGHVLRGPQPIANTLSTEAPTDFGGNLHRVRLRCGKPAPGLEIRGFARLIRGKTSELINYRTTLYKQLKPWSTADNEHLIHRSANRDWGQVEGLKRLKRWEKARKNNS